MAYESVKIAVNFINFIPYMALMEPLLEEELFSEIDAGLYDLLGLCIIRLKSYIRETAEGIENELRSIQKIKGIPQNRFHPQQYYLAFLGAIQYKIQCVNGMKETGHPVYFTLKDRISLFNEASRIYMRRNRNPYSTM